MKRAVVDAGQQFGTWTALEERQGGKWLCRCECGREKEVLKYNLQSRLSTNCGCQRKHGDRVKRIMQEAQAVQDRVKVLSFDRMLFPQFELHFDKVIDEKTWTYIRDKAGDFLQHKAFGADPAVVAHWQSIVDGKVPFGYRISSSAEEIQR